MSPFALEVAAIVQANGGPMAWAALVAAVDVGKRQKVLAAVREGVKAGVLKRNLAADAETGVTPLTVSYIGG